MLSGLLLDQSSCPGESYKLKFIFYFMQTFTIKQKAGEKIFQADRDLSLQFWFFRFHLTIKSTFQNYEKENLEMEHFILCFAIRKY